jgi:hypothetical protein
VYRKSYLRTMTKQRMGTNAVRLGLNIKLNCMESLLRCLTGSFSFITFSRKHLFMLEEPSDEPGFMRTYQIKR